MKVVLGWLKPFLFKPFLACAGKELVQCVLSLLLIGLRVQDTDLVSAIMPTRRSARLAARRVPDPEPISLDDGDTESIHSAVCEACNGPGSSRSMLHIPFAIISHIGIAWTMVSTQFALFAGLICEIFSRSVLKFIVQSAKVLQILKGVVQMQCTCSHVAHDRFSI